MAIVDDQAVYFVLFIILLNISLRNVQELLEFFHDTLNADLIKINLAVIFTNIAFIFIARCFDITTETFPEYVSTKDLHIANKTDTLSFVRGYLYLDQLIKGLKTSNHFQWKCMGDDLSNNILGGLYLKKSVSTNYALEQQTEAVVKDCGDLSRTVFVVVEHPEVGDGTLYDIFYDLPLFPNHSSSFYQDKGEKKNEEMKKPKCKRFSSLARRLETFTNSKLSADANKFADSGFYFCGKLDRVCCYECGIVLSQWKKEDDPLLEHFRYSPNCCFVASLLPEDKRHDITEQLQYARMDASNNRRRGLRDNLQQVSSLELIIDHQKKDTSAKKSARSPDYQSSNIRISTFVNFPSCNGINIQDLANAGFYYTGIQDYTSCYQCGGGLRNWEPGDNPWIEHCRWYPTCPHVQKSKGQRFVNAVFKKQAELLATQQAESRRKAQYGISSTDPLETLAAITLLEMGYPRDTVRNSILILCRHREPGAEITVLEVLDFIWKEEHIEKQRQEEEASRPRHPGDIQPPALPSLLEHLNLGSLPVVTQAAVQQSSSITTSTSSISSAATMKTSVTMAISSTTGTSSITSVSTSASASGSTQSTNGSGHGQLQDEGQGHNTNIGGNGNKNGGSRPRDDWRVGRGKGKQNDEGSDM